jgi:xylulokinase
MLAIGVFAQSEGFINCGTADVVGVSLAQEPAQTAPLLDIPLTCAPKPVLFGPTQAGGGSVAWLARLLGHTPDESVQLAASGREQNAVFVPYLAGERAPVWRGDVRGCYLGLDASSGPADIARATLLGVGFSDRHVLETALSVADTTKDRVRIAGAAAADPVWRDIRLETLGRTIEVVDEPQVTALGAAMLAACAAGADIRTVAATMRTSVQEFVPSPEQVSRASSGYQRYLEASAVSLGWGRR